MKTPEYRFTVLHRYSRWSDSSFALHTQCWAPIAGTKEEYEKAVAAFPEIDFALLYAYEKRDETTAAQELACMGGVCML
jgi:hypothetical protein